MIQYGINWNECSDCGHEPQLIKNSTSNERYDFKPQWKIQCPKCGKYIYGNTLEVLSMHWNVLNKRRKVRKEQK